MGVVSVVGVLDEGGNGEGGKKVNFDDFVLFLGFESSEPCPGSLFFLEDLFIFYSVIQTDFASPRPKLSDLTRGTMGAQLRLIKYLITLI